MRGFVAGSLALAALVGHGPAPAAQRRGFGVREVLSAPFASELMAAPTGGRAAWLVKQEGVRNVWVAVRAFEAAADFFDRRLRGER